MKNSVYRFLNKDGEVIYIGKATNLKNRISNHSHLEESCYKEVEKLEYIELQNTDEMSIYERYLINKHNPKYNIEFKNNASFSFELPEKEWKVYTGNIFKGVKNKVSEELKKKIKEHKKLGDLVIKDGNKYRIYKREF